MKSSHPSNGDEVDEELADEAALARVEFGGVRVCQARKEYSCSSGRKPE
jgi:hypothetical protein